MLRLGNDDAAFCACLGSMMIWLPKTTHFLPYAVDSELVRLFGWLESTMPAKLSAD